MVNYRLKLLDIINIYSIFYIFLFKSVLLEISNISFIEIELVNSNVIYNIEIILNYKKLKIKLIKNI